MIKQFKCKNCGYVLTKDEAKLSGWEDHPYGRHVHCPRCDRVVAQFVKETELK